MIYKSVAKTYRDDSIQPVCSFMENSDSLSNSVSKQHWRTFNGPSVDIITKRSYLTNKLTKEVKQVVAGTFVPVRVTVVHTHVHQNVTHKAVAVSWAVVENLAHHGVVEVVG